MNETTASAPASAATPTASVAVPAPVPVDTGPAAAGLWSSVLVTLVALAFVLALAWLFLRLLKRATTLRTAGGQTALQVVQAVPLGGRERLVVVRHGAHEYVLGVTPASVILIDKTTLKSSDQPPTSDDQR